MVPKSFLALSTQALHQAVVVFVFGGERELLMVHCKGRQQLGTCS